jgi:RND superfamily putative drug exporter
VLVVDVIPEGPSQGETALELVRTIRNRWSGDQADDVPLEVGGVAASTLDTRDMIGRRMPYAVAVVVIATLVLLFLMTGSLAIPVKAVVMNVLSLGASFGALVWVFQDGNL